MRICDICGLFKPVEFEYYDSSAWKNDRQVIKRYNCKECFDKNLLDFSS